MVQTNGPRDNSGIDQGPLVAELGATWLGGLEGAEHTRGDAAVAGLVADWVREASLTPRPEGVLKILRGDMTAAFAKTPAEQRVATLERMLLQRRIDYVAGRTYGLGVAIIDGTVGADEGRERGKVLLAECEALGAKTRDLPRTADNESLHRALSEALMEALFAVEGKASSARLDRYQRDHR